MAPKKGFSILIAIGTILFISILSTSIQVLMNNTAKGQRVARIRFAMSILENKIRLKLSLPETYTCNTDTTSTPPTTTCNLAANFWDQFKKTIPGAKCSPGISQCGIGVSGPLSLSSPNLTFNNIRIYYEGNEFYFNDTLFIKDIDVPLEAIANTASGTCPNTGEIFKGIQKDGTMKCDSMPSCTALPGHYFAGLNKNATAICKPLNGLSVNSSGIITKIGGLSCGKSADGSDKYTDSIKFSCTSFNGSCSLSLSCKDRVDPCNVAGSGSLCPAL